MNPNSNAPEINTEIKSLFAQAIADFNATNIDFDGECALESAIHDAKTKAIAAWWAYQLSKKNLPAVSDLLYGLAEWAANNPQYSEAESHLYMAADAVLGVEIDSKP